MVTLPDVVEEIRMGDDDAKAIALFMDSSHSSQFAVIRESDGKKINIDCFSESGEKTAFLDLAIEEDQRIRLSQIYCFTPFRNRRIATYLWELAECYLQTRIGSVVYGIYDPFQSHTDQARYHSTCTKKELESQARAFYRANGFQFASQAKEKVPETDYYSRLGYPKEAEALSQFVFRFIIAKEKVPYVETEEYLLVHENARHFLDDDPFPKKYVFTVNRKNDI